MKDIVYWTVVGLVLGGIAFLAKSQGWAISKTASVGVAAIVGLGVLFALMLA